MPIYSDEMDQLHGPHRTESGRDDLGSFFRQDIWTYEDVPICVLRVTELADSLVAVEVKTPERHSIRTADRDAWQLAALNALRDANMID